jgi:enoyl-CoA hydratase/carnithine racemase
VKLDVPHDGRAEAQLQFARRLEVGAKHTDAMHTRRRTAVWHQAVDDWHRLDRRAHRTLNVQLSVVAAVHGACVGAGVDKDSMIASWCCSAND